MNVASTSNVFSSAVAQKKFIPPAPIVKTSSPSKTNAPHEGLRKSPPLESVRSGSSKTSLGLCPTDSDVLTGRGGGINSQPGNLRYRAWVNNLRVKYSLAESKEEKVEIVNEVLGLVKSQTPPGRFLQKHPSTTKNNVVWTECSKERIWNKVSQALREGAPDIREKHIGRRTIPSSRVRAQMKANGLSYADLAKHASDNLKPCASLKTEIVTELAQKCSQAAKAAALSEKKGSLVASPFSSKLSPSKVVGPSVSAFKPWKIPELSQTKSLSMWQVTESDIALAGGRPFANPFLDDVEKKKKIDLLDPTESFTPLARRHIIGGPAGFFRAIRENGIRSGGDNSGVKNFPEQVESGSP